MFKLINIIVILVLCNFVHEIVAPDMPELFKLYQKHTDTEIPPEEADLAPIDEHISLDEHYEVETNTDLEEIVHETDQEQTNAEEHTSYTTEVYQEHKVGSEETHQGTDPMTENEDIFSK